MDYIPQRDSGPSATSAGKSLHMSAQQEAHARAVVSKMEREELEDKYLRMHEENIILKRHARKQEEKIKRMATKLIRLVNDRKRMTVQSGVKRTGRDVTLEETIENQQDTIRKLQKENELLRQKLHVANQQLHTQGKRHTPYGHIQSRINTGKDKRSVSAVSGIKAGPRTKSPSQLSSSPRPASAATPGLPRYGHSLLEEAREENRNMHNVILALQQQLAQMEAEHQMLQNEMRLKNVAHDDDVLKFKEHLNSTQKVTLSENIELIRLQRDIKEKTSALTSLEARYRELQDNSQNVRINYDKVLHEMDVLKSRLLEEENRNLNLQNQMKQGSTNQRAVAEMQHTIHDLEREVEILKNANERLTNNAFAADQEQKWRQLERKLRMQIAQLEAVIQSDVRDKDNVLGKINSERDMKLRMQEEQRRSHQECVRLRDENQELRNRLRLFSSLDDAIGVTELEEALAVIRQRRHAAEEKKRPDFLERVDDDKDPEVMFNELQVQHAETIQELEKTREMLLMQHKINKDYQIEVDSVSNRMEEMRREYENKLEHFAQLLDARAARIKKLERQLHDVAYGTKQFRYQPDEDEVEDDDQAAFDVTRLERGENLLEISITKVTLTGEAMQAINDREPSTFVTFAFYDYELVSTPIIKSGSPRFDFTSQYVVKVDDLFLHHLQKNHTLVELHQAFGTEYKTIAGCKVKLNQLLDTPQGKLHGSAVLTGSSDGGNYGTLDFWVRLRVPMDQAIRLYKERTKALGYLSANTAATQKQLDSTNTIQRDDNYNQLEIQIMSCNHVQARRKDVQPNIYCVYKFYDFADHDTAIIPNSNNPHFDDRQHFPVQMTSDLDAYLKSEKLIIYVFDDADPDMAHYLGKASIDLIPIAHDKIIRAPFQLLRNDNTENGTVEISVRWKLPYRAPPSVMKIPQTETEKREVDEQMIPEKLVTPKKPPVTTTPQKKTKPTSPKSTLKPPPVLVSPISKPEKEPDKIQFEPVSVEPVKEKPQPKARTLKSSMPQASNLAEKQTKDYLQLPQHIEHGNSKEHPEVKEKKREAEVHQEEEDSAIDEESVEDEIEEDFEEETDADDIETDTDSVVVMESPNVTKRIQDQDQIRVSVNSLALHPESWAFKDQEIQRLFVEYGVFGRVEETPVSLPKPSQPNQEISYNFSKVFHVDAKNNQNDRDHLAGMILPTNDLESTITFTVVSEPVNDEDQECDELGTASIDLTDILKSGYDVVEADLDIVSGASQELIGRLNVSVEAIGALNSIRKEVHDLLEKQQLRQTKSF